MSRRSIFLDRRRYRHRRAVDALRLLPVVGVVLFLAPLLWTQADTAPASTASSGVYLFAVWGGLIIGAGLLARLVSRSDGDAADDSAYDTRLPPRKSPSG